MRLSRLISVVALTACGMPLFRAPTPAPQSMANPPRSAEQFSSIAWHRGGCDGQCPVYTFQLFADGHASWEGECFVPLLGRYEAQSDSSIFTRAAHLITASDFFRSDTLSNVLIGGAHFTVAITLTDGRRRAVTYEGWAARFGTQLDGLLARLAWRYLGPATNACALPN